MYCWTLCKIQMASEIEYIAAVSRGGFNHLKKKMSICIQQKHPCSLILHNRVFVIWVFFLFLVFFYRAHTGRRPKTFWSWWCLAQPASLFQMTCSVPTARSLVALQKLLLRAFLTTPPKSCLEKLSTFTLTSQRSVASILTYSSVNQCFSLHRVCFINAGTPWLHRHQL